ncbi:MAG: twin transmembrane helix small protein [Rhodospirillales bacterium]
MESVAIFLMIVAMVVTLAVLFTGLISFARGGDFNRRNGNKLMRWRVMAQGAAIGLFLIAVLLKGTGSS